ENIQIDRASDYLDYKQWERNEHRSDFLLKNNIYHIACIQVFYEDKLVGEISLHRSHSQSDFTGEEMKALALITPHIQNSLSNQYTFQEAQTLNKVVFKALHTDDKGILILDTNLKIVFINEAAEMFISAKEKLHRQNLLESVKESCSYLKETAKRDFVMSWHITDSRKLFSNVIKLKTLVITDELTQKSYYFWKLTRGRGCRHSGFQGKGVADTQQPLSPSFP
ncbi:MAG: hypothetical protein M1543_03220, partial [Firmicutes bacterium]|nr:hypothetical protein [Bacillota bacterium]